LLATFRVFLGAVAMAYKAAAVGEAKEDIQGVHKNVSSLTTVFTSPANSFFKDRVQSKVYDSE
jgi:hypothetical protein